MSKVQDPWQVLLEKAKDDLRVAAKFRDDPDVTDEQVGFFCQQAIEKSIKSLLSKRHHRYGWDHDLSLLFDLLAAHGLTSPPDRTGCEGLTPFAARLRYDRLTVGASGTPFDRVNAVALAKGAVDWAIVETK